MSALTLVNALIVKAAGPGRDFHAISFSTFAIVPNI